jgi:hypothetical protein
VRPEVSHAFDMTGLEWWTCQGCLEKFTTRGGWEIHADKCPMDRAQVEPIDLEAIARGMEAAIEKARAEGRLEALHATRNAFENQDPEKWLRVAAVVDVLNGTIEDLEGGP